MKIFFNRYIMTFVILSLSGLLFLFQNCSSSLQSRSIQEGSSSSTAPNNTAPGTSNSGPQQATCSLYPNQPDCQTCGIRPIDDIEVVQCPNVNLMRAQQAFTYVCNATTRTYVRTATGAVDTSQCTTSCAASYPGGRRQVSCPTGQTGMAYQNYSSTCNTNTGLWSTPVPEGTPDYSSCMTTTTNRCPNGAVNYPTCTACPFGQQPVNGICSVVQSTTCAAGSSAMVSPQNSAGQTQTCNFTWSAITTSTSQIVNINGTPAGSTSRSCGPGGWTVLSQPTCPAPAVTGSGGGSGGGTTNPIACAGFTQTQNSPDGSRVCSYTVPTTTYSPTAQATVVTGVVSGTSTPVAGSSLTAMCTSNTANGFNGWSTTVVKVCPNPVKCPAQSKVQQPQPLADIETTANDAGVKHLCAFNLPETTYVGSNNSLLSINGSVTVTKTGSQTGSVVNNDIGAVTAKCGANGQWSEIVRRCNPPLNTNVSQTCEGQANYVAQSSGTNNLGERRLCRFTWPATNRPGGINITGTEATPDFPASTQGTLQMSCIADGMGGAKWDPKPNNQYPAICPNLPNACPQGNSGTQLVQSTPNNAGQRNSCFFEWGKTYYNATAGASNMVLIRTAKLQSISGTLIIGARMDRECTSAGTWNVATPPYCPPPADTQPSVCNATTHSIQSVANSAGTQTCTFSIPQRQLTSNASVTVSGIQGTPGGKVDATCNTNGQWTYAVVEPCPQKQVAVLTCPSKQVPLTCNVRRLCAQGFEVLDEMVRGDVMGEFRPGDLPVGTTTIATLTNLKIVSVGGQAVTEAQITHNRPDYGGLPYSCTADSSSAATWKQNGGGHCDFTYVDQMAQCPAPGS